ncbi:BON domain-containing protein [Singulisphaera acidiphila]|uniref:Putative periplasmic or secreted lipoprotein n=1 Tax=Singulisphaera acidiphila (strain ATCC BAA-1392 / DSM 18658 / VKM B-2454 / MOB10) TaxID=886293 RepID=L0DDV4_SINAD|nr:BON domain-containing protein [Singulisphaera acidiphila]AGA26841.1 putative periplasmic or secreted lipoprotein [Singulisphaera acidiphila DSM 18658]
MTVSLTHTHDREILALPGVSLGAGLSLEVERRLRGSGYLALRGVSYEVCAGIVRLRGCLPTYYLKQVAQAIVSEIDDVDQIINQIEIVAPAGRSPLGREGNGEETMGVTGSNPCERGLPSWEGPSPSTHPEGSGEQCWS